MTAAKRRTKTGDRSFVSFRSRKAPVQSFFVPKSAVSTHGIYYTMLGTLRMREALPATYRDCRLVCAYGAYYLAVSVTVPQREAENQGCVVALDPGVRSFMTFFAEEGCGKFAHGDFSRIQRAPSHFPGQASRSAR